MLLETLFSSCSDGTIISDQVNVRWLDIYDIDYPKYTSINRVAYRPVHFLQSGYTNLGHNSKVSLHTQNAQTVQAVRQTQFASQYKNRKIAGYVRSVSDPTLVR